MRRRKISAITPTDNTPMGDGLDRVLGVTSYFEPEQASIDNDRRWLILMSDGSRTPESSPIPWRSSTRTAG